MVAKEKMTPWDVAETFFNTLNHVFIGTITFYMSFFCAKLGLKNQLPLHALLCTLGVSLNIKAKSKVLQKVFIAILHNILVSITHG